MNLGHIGYEPDVAHFVNPGIQLVWQVLCIFSLKLSKFCALYNAILNLLPNWQEIRFLMQYQGLMIHKATLGTNKHF